MPSSVEQAVDIAGWPADDEAPIYPEGSREKRLLRCPAIAPHPSLTPGHRYLFKKSRQVYPDQFWVEIAAARLGILAGVAVPPAFAAWDSSTGECAALIEWFYGKPGEPAENFLAGGHFMKALIKDYDYKSGRQHNFATIEAFCKTLTGAGLLDPDWPAAWARMLTFDALIGNTDRHHDNWGFVVRRGREQAEFRLAPAFDNGTSLGHEIMERNFARFADAGYLNRYIERGCHHLRWQAGDKFSIQHTALILKLREKYPQCRAASLGVLQINDAALEAQIADLGQIVLPQPLSPERARFMLTLLRVRLARLSATMIDHELH